MTMMTADHRAIASRRPSFPTVSRNDAEFDNLLLAAAPSFETRLDASVVTISVMPARFTPSGLVVAGTFDGTEIWIAIPALVLPSLIPGMATDTALDHLPDELARAVAAVALPPLLDGLGEAVGGRFVGTGPLLPPPPTGTALSLRTDAGVDLVNIVLSPPATLAMTGRLHALVPAVRWRGAEDVPVAVDMEFARVGFTVAELSSLRRGDIALLPVGCDPDALRLLAGTEAAAFAVARRDGNTVTVEAAMGEPMRDDEDLAVTSDRNTDDIDDVEPGDAAGTAEAPSVDDLPVELSFGLGTQQLTVAQLRTLAPGYRFVLDVPKAGEVSISAGGREIGRGELVQIDDRLGVRIVQLRVADDG